jgi:hypothetical protein
MAENSGQPLIILYPKYLSFFNKNRCMHKSSGGPRDVLDRSPTTLEFGPKTNYLLTFRLKEINPCNWQPT